MKYYKLDKKEKQILQDYEKGEFRSIRNTKKEKKKYQAYARAALNKTKNINIRVSEGDLQKIKSLASEKGIPYQTLVSSLIHQYSSGRAKIPV